ncbi:deoxyribodipyrimidine photo-lyase [Dyella monticola]|uniref:Deoxyribodipyrimidine photo-lyase n=1 Tax=Dyella monticola TaxID=1927958 RepID=A0A370WUH2_9GAMM|nr:deoxyribodipyrimidine photo-lyase [Dyella monticola]RDS79666.1 deoxyribodipyrimidine photo-lyase [Dyella monticola]
MTTAIVLFRRDLRLNDNPALSAAYASHSRVLPLYIHTENEDAPWQLGGASRWWLHHSLRALHEQLRERGGQLHLCKGNTLPSLRDVIEHSGTRAVYWNRRYEPAAIARDTHVKQALREQGIEVHSYSATLWREPWQVQTKQDAPYRVFTPYWRSVRPTLSVVEPLPEPTGVEWADIPGSAPLEAFELLPRIPWYKAFGESWCPGERGAWDMLELFCDDALRDYAAARDRPARHGTSRLSPHLHFGEISPQQIFHALHRHAQRIDTRRRPDIEPYLRELGWREFAYHLLYHFPRTPVESFNPRFADFPWAPDDDALLRRWQQGRTGIPLVDAGMRELWQTGWMHNRVRMVVASLLTKNLRQHWLHGARWFWDTLVDADLANNTLGWQWVAGCGADAAPYFRIFNPVSQAQKFDPDGTYLRRWLPELAQLPNDLLHEPWKDASVAQRTGYLPPMLNLQASRAAALGAYASWHA